MAAAVSLKKFQKFQVGLQMHSLQVLENQVLHLPKIMGLNELKEKRKIFLLKYRQMSYSLTERLYLYFNKAHRENNNATPPSNFFTRLLGFMYK